MGLAEIDQDLQARVWSRVNGRTELPPLPEPAGRFSAMTGELAANYRQLGQKMPVFRGLERDLLQNQNQIFALQALRGIRESRRMQPPPRGTAKVLLERSCHLERRLAAALEANGNDPQWGEVFAMLARQARQRCLTALAIRGKLDG